MKRQIFIFGASTEWGAWDLKGGGWPERLKLFLFDREEKGVNREYDFHNLSISGNTSAHILKRFRFEARQRINKEYYDDIVIIFAVGTNDAAYLNSKSRKLIAPKAFEKNLIKLIAEAGKYSKNIIFKGLFKAKEEKTSPCEWDKNVSCLNENLAQYDEIIRKVCAKNDARYIEIKKVIQKTDLYDGSHPNSEGHRKIFETFKRFLLKNKLI